MVLDVEKAARWIHRLNGKIQEQKQYLTDLDQAIGDGDHGINLARGFQEAANAISANSYQDLGALCKDVAMTLIGKVGGASGPLYGTAFMKLSMAWKGQKEIDREAMAKGFKDALEGLKMRGKAQPGDKTMIDVWEPAVAYMAGEGPLNGEELASVAKEKMEGTKELEAKKGRAAYLGKRSIGHIDPGAASSYLLFSTLAEVIGEGESA
ncbi:dihydroxyacetone kinase subunit DhaL [Caldibacillus debilis]|jgi:dihydroxyacetone kinase-like protein|uniref:phosphoenolpyruvate--glycerone phosphotransferase n=1 Tax=Caldibacillus debilis GB1 TaxID=1339248 RepID=A0A420VHF8_9BACI|nr:dihydroxyacetone kinase subunit DhaL [Caldibacillus debilis]RKO62980.1 dihydroxyacetone kinase DhaL subunit [Caldibacillus debilis GB1]